MNKKLLKELCDTQGVAGYEDEIQKIVIRELLPCCDEVYQDRMNSVIGVKRAKGLKKGEEPLKVMFCAHSDEAGFLVREVTGDGYIRLRGFAGPNKMSMCGQQVRIQGIETVYGILVPTSDQIKEFPTVDNMLVHTGCDPKWVKEHIRVGDRGTFNIDLSFFNNDIISGRNFDDRLGVFCMVEAMKKIKSSKVDIYAVASVQEEIGTRGAMVASQSIQPDIGIAIDGGCVTSPMHGPKDGWTSVIGKGAAIYQLDNLTVCNKNLNGFIKKMGDKKNIPYHDNWHGGTDAHQMQKQGKGAYATTIGVPSAYMHWANGLADLRDVQAVTDLLAVVGEEAHKMGIQSDAWTAIDK